MRFKDGGRGSKGELPTEYPFAVVVEDMESAVSHMYVITREKVYRFDPVTFMALMTRYAEGVVSNDPENIPDLDKVRNATAALRGLVGKN
jgi:hypothetical protein